MKLCARRSARLSLAGFVAILACFALPAVASAASATVRIEGTATTLVPRTTIHLPAGPVAPPTNQQPDETCVGNSVVGAVDTVTHGNWNGTWDAGGAGWSIDRILTQTALPVDNRKWEVLINDVLSTTPPCTTTIDDGSTVTLIPTCFNGATSGCVNGFLELYAPLINGPGNPINMHVFQVLIQNIQPDGSGGNAARGPAINPAAAVIGPDNSTLTDQKYGTGDAQLTIAEKGPAVIVAQKNGLAHDTANICITDGADGFCGTTQAPPVPFNPLDFCTTTGSDGYCGSPDHVAPLGRIVSPSDTSSFIKGKGPTKITGTVDFDPSLTDHVNLRLVRQITITVKKVTKRRVFVTKKIHGKKVRKRVIKRKTRKVKQKACYYWSDAATLFKRMKTCNVDTAPLFPATGAEIWSYEFLSAVPSGSYTLDVQAVDGAGNVDSTPEVGRNRVTFKVA